MQYRKPVCNENDAIDCEIEHPEYGWIPFTASPEDCEEHGRELYARIVKEHPDLPAWVAPEGHYEAIERAKRDRLLIELDELVKNPLRWASYTEEEQASLAAYRQSLLDVPQQTGFPSEIEWPDKPGVLTWNTSEEERANLTSREEALSRHSALIYQLNAVYDAHVSGLSDDDAISRADAARDAVRDIIPTLTDPDSYDVEIAFRAHLRRQP